MAPVKYAKNLLPASVAVTSIFVGRWYIQCYGISNYEVCLCLKAAW